MKKRNWEYLIATITICTSFSLLTVILWFSLEWFSLLIILPCTIILELILLQWIDSKHELEEKQKLIQLGIISPSDTQLLSTETEDEIGQLKSFIRLNLTDLNEVIIGLEEGYREALEKLDVGEIEEAKSQFKSTSTTTVQKYKVIEEEVENQFEEFIIPDDKDKKFLYTSYRENWNTEKKRMKEKIEDIINKFRVRSEYTVHIEDILRFEVENKRPIIDDDIKKMKFPYHQANQLIKFIEKPIILKIEDLSPEEKQKYGTLGRKIIETCATSQITPTLPYLVIKMGITIQEAKKILTYLHLIGMIETIFYHYTKKESG